MPPHDSDNETNHTNPLEGSIFARRTVASVALVANKNKEDAVITNSDVLEDESAKPVGQRPTGPQEGGVVGTTSINTVRHRTIKWVGGMPRLVDQDIPVIDADAYRNLAIVALNTPYRGRLDPTDKTGGTRIIEPEYEGLTNIEVMNLRLASGAAAGDMDAMNMLLDRIQGKPQQKTMTVSASMSYEDFLKNEALKEMGGGSPPSQRKILDVTVETKS